VGGTGFGVEAPRVEVEALSIEVKAGVSDCREHSAVLLVIGDNNCSVKY
jgi:hypothetical protein